MSSERCPAIYAIINTKTLHHYIGQSKYVRIRKTANFTALKAGVHPSKKMQAAYNENPESLKFFLVEECTIDQLAERERYWIEETRPEYNTIYMVKHRPLQTLN